MVAKKSENKKFVGKKSATKVADKVVKKKAVSKLKTEVNKTKKESTKSVAKIQKQEIIEIKDEQVKKKEITKMPLSSNTFVKQNGYQGQGKIGEIKNGIARATGHRKRAIAKVSCGTTSGKLSISVNDLDYKEFFTKLVHQEIVCAPFVLLGINTGYVVNAEVFGGGKSGQADALKLGLSRCLAVLSEEYAKILRKNSFLTRDTRKVEPKKAGLKKARKKEQFSKR